MKNLYECFVVTGEGPDQRVTPMGVTDSQARAVNRMLEALQDVPRGVLAQGWVLAVVYVPLLCCYDRYETRAHAERNQNGTLHLVTGGGRD